LEKYIIPIPDASKLRAERGLFWYAEEEMVKVHFWIDELKFEKIRYNSQGIYFKWPG
jgi:hypothetical protein